MLTHRGEGTKQGSRKQRQGRNLSLERASRSRKLGWWFPGGLAPGTGKWGCKGSEGSQRGQWSREMRKGEALADAAGEAGAGLGASHTERCSTTRRSGAREMCPDTWEGGGGAVGAGGGAGTPEGPCS